LRASSPDKAAPRQVDERSKARQTIRHESQCRLVHADRHLVAHRGICGGAMARLVTI